MGPFPIIIANGESVTLELQLTLNEEIAKGAQVSLKMKLEGLIDLPIPCALPLLPGVYGGGEPLVIGPLESIPDALAPFLKGTIHVEAKAMSASGELLACIWVRAVVDH